MAELFARLDGADSLTSVLVSGRPNLLSILRSDGAAVVIGKQVLRVGHTPREKEILALCDWLGTHQPSGLFATDQLQQWYGSGILGGVASGVLAVTVAAAGHHHVLWFRPEQERTVDWAGDPRKKAMDRRV